ncbi:MAG: ABC transporter ATP-binding protein [Deinococcus sp.]|nr:ABC transporter ATP-binding protein [Deinococcus sp.]
MNLLVRDLHFAYGPKPVLNGISFTLAAGQVLGVLGPNGSGKSTLLRCLTGALRAQGTIEWDQRPVHTIPRLELAKKVALVPQNPHLPEGFTALEVVLLGRTPHLKLWDSEGPKDLAICHSALERTSTLELAMHRVEQLSGGERQRLALALALAQEPEALLLDEPTAHLDLHHQLATLDSIRTLVQSGLAVLLVMHDLNLATSICDYILLLCQGAVRYQGPPAEVITEAHVREVYGAEVMVVPHPQSGEPVVLSQRSGRHGTRPPGLVAPRRSR